MAKSNFLDSSKPLFSKPISLSMDDNKQQNPLAKEFLGYLLSVPNKAKLAHLRVKGIGAFAAHMALGEFYDSFADKADELIEVYQGMYGVQDLAIPGTSFMDPIDALTGCREYIQSMRYKACEASHLQNIIDEMIALTDRTIYKLENLK
jgi:hypothetical protein